MTYQYKREPLSIEEADRLFTVADTSKKNCAFYGLLETGLRVSELVGLSKQQIQWQQRAIRIKRKGGSARPLDVLPCCLVRLRQRVNVSNSLVRVEKQSKCPITRACSNPTVVVRSIGEFANLPNFPLHCP